MLRSYTRRTYAITITCHFLPLLIIIARQRHHRSFLSSATQLASVVAALKVQLEKVTVERTEFQVRPKKESKSDASSASSIICSRSFPHHRPLQKKFNIQPVSRDVAKKLAAQTDGDEEEGGSSGGQGVLA